MYKCYWLENTVDFKQHGLHCGVHLYAGFFYNKYIPRFCIFGFNQLRVRNSIFTSQLGMWMRKAGCLHASMPHYMRDLSVWILVHMRGPGSSPTRTLRDGCSEVLGSQNLHGFSTVLRSWFLPLSHCSGVTCILKTWIYLYFVDI